MAILTGIQCPYMVPRLSGRCCTVVATGTAGGHTGVVKYGSREGIGVMTVIAGIAAGDMVGGFTRGRCAIVATGACSQHRGMVNPGHIGEIAGVMTILTGI
jgi:hypothetical protein